VEFKRPGAIVKAGTVHPVGSSDPAFTLVLTNLVAAKRPSMMDRLKRLSCIRLPSRQAPSTRADLAGSSNSSQSLAHSPLDLLANKQTSWTR